MRKTVSASVGGLRCQHDPRIEILRQRRWRTVPTMALVAAVVAATNGCGGSPSGGSPTSSPTAPSSFAPALTAIVPASARPQTDVTVTGKNLLTATQQAPVVYFDRFIATVKTATNTDLLVTVPAVITSAATVTVNVDGQTSNGVSFSAQAADLLDGFYSGALVSNGVARGTISFTIIHNGGYVSSDNPSSIVGPGGECMSGGIVSNVKNDPVYYGTFSLIDTSYNNYNLSGHWTTPTSVSGTFQSVLPQCSGSFTWTATKR
jgi:hypothetical protein